MRSVWAMMISNSWGRGFSSPHSINRYSAEPEMTLSGVPIWWAIPAASCPTTASFSACWTSWASVTRSVTSSIARTAPAMSPVARRSELPRTFRTTWPRCRVSCSKRCRRTVGAAPESRPSTEGRRPSHSRGGKASKRFRPRTSASVMPYRSVRARFQVRIRQSASIPMIPSVMLWMTFRACSPSSTIRRRASARFRPNALNAPESCATSSRPDTATSSKGCPLERSAMRSVSRASGWLTVR